MGKMWKRFSMVRIEASILRPQALERKGILAWNLNCTLSEAQESVESEFNGTGNSGSKSRSGNGAFSLMDRTMASRCTRDPDWTSVWVNPVEVGRPMVDRSQLLARIFRPHVLRFRRLA